jgi:hypothetical protein
MVKMNLALAKSRARLQSLNPVAVCKDLLQAGTIQFNHG